MALANDLQPSTRKSPPRFHQRVHPFLLSVVLLAGLVAGAIVMAQQSCGLKKILDYSGSTRCRETVEPRAEWEPHHRYTYSDFLWDRVDRMKMGSEDWDNLLAASSVFDTRDFRLHMVMKLVKHYFKPWTGPSTRTWNVTSVREAAVSSNVMSCCLHVRVVDGVVYFRYGQVVSLAWRLSRANDFITFLQLTIDHFQLKSLRLEFYFNTCDHPLATGAAFSTTTEISNRANFLIFSNHMTDTNTDVLVPDFLDWGDGYMPTKEELASASQSKWEDKVPKLVFRGSTTNYLLEHFNWGASARVRAHRMTDAFPHLLDARISRWSHTTPGIVWHMKRDKVDLAPRLNFTQKNDFKYELVMDGGLGTTRLCGVLSTGRLVVRQSSPFFQFFDPLLKRNRHFVEVKHNLQDLSDAVIYMQQHDEEMQQMVKAAQRDVGWICSVEGRMLAFAVVLIKYQALLQDTALVEKPKQMCKWGAPRKHFVYTRNEEPECMDKEKSPILEQPGCPTVCSFYGLRLKDWYWLSSKDLHGWRSWNDSS